MATGFGTIILAAGQGKRMKSDLPKVLHSIAGKSMIQRVIDTAQEAGAERIVAVLGHGREEVEAALPEHVEVAVQDKQLGTGHAVMCAEQQLKDYAGPIVVLCGDVPLIRPATIRNLVEKGSAENASAVVLTAIVDGEHSYGRIVRDENGSVKRIVEHKDASDEEKEINEINTGTFSFAPWKLFEALKQLNTDNAQGEYYLTDTIEIFEKRGEKVAAEIVADKDECRGINSQEELQAAEEVWEVYKTDGAKDPWLEDTPKTVTFRMALAIR